MKSLKEIAEEYCKNYKYAEQQLEILRNKYPKTRYDLKRIDMLGDIYYEQKGLYKRCISYMMKKCPEFEKERLMKNEQVHKCG